MKSTGKKRLRNSKGRIERRLGKRRWQEQRRRLFQDQNVHDDVAAKALWPDGLAAPTVRPERN